ncbi:MAG: RNA polymerase sigma factor [Saprospiraceae bacterium]|nr:RNA polymerase sigma factor [Saprospiraceae bacterium]MBK8819612.1 RNA polymerase sigma factor [Saprospiraceae bacterium]
MLVEQDLLLQCQKGDQSAYSTLYKTCAPYVFTIVKNYFSEDHDRKDVLQEIFAHIFTSLENFDQNKGSFKSWISRIAVHQCINVLRKNNRLNIVYTMEIMEDIEYDTLETLEKFTVKDLEKMLMDMPDGYKTIFLLSVIEEYSHKEIGEMLSITQETSRSQLFRAIKWIKNNILNTSNMIQYGLLQ